MRSKPVYVGRISDNVYYIYRLSDHSYPKVELIRAGLAFDKQHSNFSNAAKKAFSTFEINTNRLFTNDTFKDFKQSLYLHAKQTGIIAKEYSYDIPPKVYDMLKIEYKRNNP